MQSLPGRGVRRRDQPFEALGSWIREGALTQALSLPVLSLIAEPIPSGSGASSLHQLTLLFRDLTVGNLLQPGPHLRPHLDWRPEQDLANIERDLQRSIRRRYRAAAVGDLATLVKAIRDQGLGHVLDIPVDALGFSRWGPPSLRGISVLRALESSVIPQNLRESLIRYVQDVLLDDEEDRQAAKQEEAELRALQISAPLDGLAKELEAGLLNAWTNLARGGPRVGPLRRLVTRLEVVPGRVLHMSMALSGSWGDPGVRAVTVSFVQWPGQILFTCDCGRPVACSHMLESVASTLWHLRSAEGAAAAWELGTPGWEKVLAAAAPLGEEAAEPEERALWRVFADPNLLPRIEPAIQRRRARSWTAGRTARPHEILALPGLDPVDRRIAEALRGAEHVAEAQPALAGALMEWLEASPNAVFLSSGEPFVLKRARLEMVVDADAEGFQVLPTLDGDGSTWPLLKQAGPGQGAVLDDDGRRVLLFSTPAETERVVQSLRDHGTRFDRRARERMMSMLDYLEGYLPLRLAPSLLGVAAEASRRTHLRLDLRPDGVEVEVRVRPLFGASPELPGQGPNPVSRFVMEAGKRLFATRDLTGEVDRARRVVSQLGLPASLEQDDWSAQLRGDPALDLVLALQRQTIDGLVVEWPPQRLRVAGDVPTHALRVQVREGRDWFNLTGSLEIDGDRVGLAAVLRAMRDGRRYVAIAPDHWASLENALRTRLSRLSEVSRPGDAEGDLSVGPTAAPVVEDLSEGAGEVDQVPAWQHVVRRLHAAQHLDPALPEDLQASLRPYQREGFSWLMRLAAWGVGGVLADDMGLGKTVQTLAMLLARRGAGPALVVAPTSVCFNWIREAQRFAPSLRVMNYRNTAREVVLDTLQPGDVLVASYGLVTRDAERFQRSRFATLVLDEAHAVKNPSARRTAAVRSIPADWTLGLTGTPLENHLGELWSLFAVVSPGLLGGFEGFKQRYMNPIEVSKDRAKLASLSRVLRPFILRRTKDQVAPDLPPRTEILQEIVLSAEERKLYQAARWEAVSQLGGEVLLDGDKGRFKVLAAITRLRQLACHPRLVIPESKVPSSKLGAVVDRLLQLREEGHRALVFSQFVEHLGLLREALVRVGIDHLYLDGSTPEKARMERVEAFQGGQGEAFLISLKAGSTGLNLTGADYVIHLDPWWNPAVEDQATDRAHRIGQTRPVTAYRMVAKGTIEEAILALHAEKRELMAGILEGTSAPAKLSSSELLDLIRTGAAEETLSDAEGDDTPAQ